MTQPIGSFAGIGSGFDYRDLVDGIIEAESVTVKAESLKVDKANAQLAAYNTYRLLLSNLNSAIESLKDGSAVQGVSTTVAGAVTASGKTVLSAQGSVGADPGSYSIRVLQTAQAEKLSSTSFSEANVPLGITGDLETGGGTITIEASDTLSDIRDKINSTSGSGIAATIISDSANIKRLVLTSTGTGSAGAGVDLDGNIATQLGLYTLVEGQDAIFSVDGVEVQRPSNVIDDMIANVTINLLEADTDVTVTLTVERSVDYAANAVNKFVESFNKVVDYIKDQQQAVDGRTAPLHNNPTLRLARSALPSIMFNQYGEDNDTTLGSIGISLTKDGFLSLDTETFQKAFKTDLSSVKAALQGAGESMDRTLDSWIGTGGLLSLTEQSLTDRISTSQDRIERLNDRLALRKQMLLKQFLAMDVAVQRFQSQGNAFFSAISSSPTNQKGQ